MGYVDKNERDKLIGSVDHVNIEVSDISIAGKSWSKLLGKEPDIVFREASGAHMRMRFALKRGAIEIVENGQDRLRALTFACKDLVASASQFRKQGLTTGELKRVELVSSHGETCVETSCEVSSSCRRGRFVRLVERSDPSWIRLRNQSNVLWLDHIVIKTAEPEKAKGFYGSGLGLRLPLDKTFPQWKARMMFFRTAGVTIEVTAAIEKVEQETDTLWGLAYRVAEATDERARLEKDGFIVGDLRPGRKAGTSVFDLKNAPAGIPTLILGRDTLNA